MSRSYRPQRIRGRHALSARMVQIVGGHRWSLVLMWDMEAQRDRERPDYLGLRQP